MQLKENYLQTTGELPIIKEDMIKESKPIEKIA